MPSTLEKFQSYKDSESQFNKAASLPPSIPPPLSLGLVCSNSPKLGHLYSISVGTFCEL